MKLSMPCIGVHIFHAIVKILDLLHIASDRFDCRYNYSTSDQLDLQFGLSSTPLKVTMMGPIVLVSTIKERFSNTEMDHASEQLYI